MTAQTSAAATGQAPASEQKLTAQELDQARKFLEQTRNAVLGATRGLSEPQWRFKPAPDRWSVAENLDHIVIVQERVLGPILDQLADAPAPPADRECETVDAIVPVFQPPCQIPGSGIRTPGERDQSPRALEPAFRQLRSPRRMPGVPSGAAPAYRPGGAVEGGLEGRL